MDKATALAILEALGIDTNPRKVKAGGGGKYIYTLCPLHDDSDPSFSITLSGGGSWRCFGCNQRGSSLGKLIDAVEGVGSQSPARELWRKDLEPWKKAKGFDEQEEQEDPRANVDHLAQEIGKMEWEEKERRDQRVLFDYPLMPEVEYRKVGRPSPYFATRGFTDETCEYWQLGDDPHLKRALVPIRDFRGNLVGVQGRSYATECRCGLPFERWADDPRAVKGKKGRVKYCPSCGEIRPMKYLTTRGFQKSFFLFGEHMLDLDLREAILVESPMSVLWLWQNGYQNAVATMGSLGADPQHRKILAWFHSIFLFADGDPKLSPDLPPAGYKWGLDISAAVGRYVQVRGRVCPLGKDPADLSPEELEAVLGPPGGIRKDIKTRAKDQPGHQQNLQYYL